MTFLSKIRTIPRPLMLAGLISAATLVWAYWTTFTELVRRWSVEPTYSHGFLVPLFALFLLASRGDHLEPARLRPSWWGLLFVALGTAFRLASTYFAISAPDRFSILVVLVGLCVGLGGWAAFRWAWPGIVFLLFMLPLPAGIDRLLAGPMQRIATLCSTYALQTLGFVAEAEGNVIVLAGGELNVVEACSGLRMFMTFCALSAALAFVARRSLPQRLVIAASAFPLAIICNVVRITLTGVVHETLGGETAQMVFHDLAGWLMIVLAVLLQLLELKLLTRLFLSVQEAEWSPFVRTKQSREEAKKVAAAS